MEKHNTDVEYLRRLAEGGNVQAMLEYMKRKGYIEVTGVNEGGDEMLKLTPIGLALAEQHNIRLDTGPHSVSN